jgi:hypothetical protein
MCKRRPEMGGRFRTERASTTRLGSTAGGVIDGRACAGTQSPFLSLSLSLSQRELCADDCEFHEFLGRFLSIFYFLKPKTHHKKKDCSHGFVLFLQFCEVSKWVGDSDFLLAKFRNLATGKKKRGWACHK